MKWHQSIEIEASSDEVWELVGERFGELAAWASPVHRSAMKDDRVRVCHTSMGTVEERIQDIDVGQRTLTYEAVVRPRWMRRGENRIQVVDLGRGRCRVDADARIELEPSQAWRLLAAIPDVRRLARTLDDLKVFAETGRPSERKRSRSPHPASYALWANALFSAATGLLLVFDVGTISAAVRVPDLVSRAVGAGLLLFAGFVAWAATRVRPWLVIAISLADACWVLLSVVAIAMEPTRLVWVGGTADVVLVVAALQIWGLEIARRRAWIDSESRGT